MNRDKLKFQYTKQDIPDNLKYHSDDSDSSDNSRLRKSKISKKTEELFKDKNEKSNENEIKTTIKKSNKNSNKKNNNEINKTESHEKITYSFSVKYILYIPTVLKYPEHTRNI